MCIRFLKHIKGADEAVELLEAEEAISNISCNPQFILVTATDEIFKGLDANKKIYTFFFV